MVASGPLRDPEVHVEIRGGRKRPQGVSSGWCKCGTEYWSLEPVEPPRPGPRPPRKPRPVPATTASASIEPSARARPVTPMPMPTATSARCRCRLGAGDAVRRLAIDVDGQARAVTLRDRDRVRGLRRDRADRPVGRDPHRERGQRVVGGPGALDEYGRPVRHVRERAIAGPIPVVGRGVDRDRPDRAVAGRDLETARRNLADLAAHPRNDDRERLDGVRAVRVAGLLEADLITDGQIGCGYRLAALRELDARRSTRSCGSSRRRCQASRSSR